MNKKTVFRYFALSSVLVASIFATSSCDTVALISFQERDFASVNAIGLSPLAGSCDAIGDKGRFRFVLVADDQTAIRPGEAVGRQDVFLDTSKLSFLGSALDELPDRVCQAQDTCPMNGFTCVAEQDIASRRCEKDVELVPTGDVQFESDTKKDRLFGVLVENAGSIGGWFPSDIGALAVDTDNDGMTDITSESAPWRDSASDRNERIASLSGILNNWEKSREKAATEDRKTLFGLWEFSSGGINSLVSQVGTKKEWTDSRKFARDAATKFSDVSGTRANVYKAISRILSNEKDGVIQGFATEKYADYDKTLVVIVDGNDDLRLSEFNATKVAAKAKAGNVKIYFVHFDPEIKLTHNGVPSFRDDLKYWVQGSAGQAVCTDDDTCLNFESCREPMLYSNNISKSVDIPNGHVAGNKYCLPLRQEDGRLGPIHDYATIACETGGGYLYGRDNRTIRDNSDWLPFTMDGVWSVETTVDAFEDKLVDTKTGYFLKTNFSVTLGSRLKRTDLSRAGRTSSVEATRDTRLPIFN